MAQNPGPSTREDLNFSIIWQANLLEIGFAGKEIFNLKSGFEEFRRRNPNITRRQGLIGGFTNQLSVYPPTNTSKINKAFILMLLDNSVNDIRDIVFQTPRVITQRPNFPTFQNPEQRQQYYRNIVNNIMREVANSPQDNATTSLMNVATSLNNAATNGDATSLSDAANSLVVAANSLNNQHHSIVFVYDIDQIAMFTSKLISEHVLIFPEINASLFSDLMFRTLNSIDFRGMELIYEDVANIRDNMPNQTVSDKYNRLKQLYNEISAEIREGGPIISHELIDKAGMTAQKGDLIQAAEQLERKYAQPWQNTKNCLKLVNQKSRESDKKYANVVVTKERIAYGAIQLMISGSCSEIQIDNIYTIDKRSKESIFDKIQQRFGEKCVLVYVTAAYALSSVPLKPRLHVWPVDHSQSFATLFNAQKDVLLR